MKKVLSVVAVALLSGAVSGMAQTNSFTVSVKGTITQRNGTQTKIGDVSGTKPKCSELVTDCANVLVLIADENNNFTEIAEVQTGASNTIVSVIWESNRQAITAAGKFNAGLVSSGTVALPNGIPSFNGDVQVDGKISTSGKTSFSGKLIGVWNDDAANSADPAAVFKGTLKSTGTITTPVDY